jgi:3-deoxy-D-manno-octulosonate 8-phosphate phosphatase (KDO 8-P phosphatase)
MCDLARRIALLALDVDGVLTDNGVYVGLDQGQRIELKRFDIRDGLGLALLRGSPIRVAWVSGRPSEATALRAAELGIPEVIQAPAGHKLPPLQALLDRLGLEWDAVAFVGDDLADLPVLRRVGLPVAVADAVSEVKAAAVWITDAPGGYGAVREVIERLLRARGEYEPAVERYLHAREGGGGG